MRRKSRHIGQRKPLIGILMGSDSDWSVMQQAAKVLEEFGVPCESRVLSAHRTPALVRQYVTRAPESGLKILIAGAGGAAHLAGALAAHTILPVIGVPIMSKQLKGLDSLLATVQMPKGVPVATVALDNAANAALLAVQCLALNDRRLTRALAAYRKKLVAKSRKADRGLQRA